MTSLLTKSAIDSFPAEIRDNIRVEKDTGFSVTISMPLDVLEALVRGTPNMLMLQETVVGLEGKAAAVEDDLDDALGEVRSLEDELAELRSAAKAVVGMIADEHHVCPPRVAEALEHLEGLL